MKVNIWKIISAFLFVVIFFGAAFTNDLLWKSREKLNRDKAIERGMTELKLTKWIYDHSNKISIKTARSISVEVMKTSKPLFMLALISVESEFVPAATSSVGAKGLTQVMWKTWGADLIKAGIAKEEKDLFDIDTSVKAGNYVLDKCLIQANGDMAKALEKYLGGKDGWYKNKITENLSNLYIASEMVQPK